MNIAILLYDGVTALDVVGPYEVLARIPGAHVEFPARQSGAIRTDTGFLELTATASLDETTGIDVLVVPGGGNGARLAAEDNEILDWIRRTSEQAQYTASICTGSIILAAAGLLKGRRATTHWSDFEELRAYGVEPVERRIVESGRIITSAGVSAGIDMALALAERLAGCDSAEAIQLLIEYDPDPPFNSGTPRHARREVLALCHEMMRTSRLTEEGRSSIRALENQDDPDSPTNL